MSASTYGLSVVTAQTAEPLSLAQAQSHLRISGDDSDDDYINSLITTAREYVEETTGRQLMPAQYLMTLEYFPGRRIDEYRPPGWRYGIIRMPRPPLISIDEVQYVDPDLNTYTLDPSQYRALLTTEPGKLYPAPFVVWPATDPWTADAVQVTFTCGYANGAVPQRMLQAMRFLIGHLYENRELSVTGHALFKIPMSLQSFIESCGYGEIT